MLHEEAPSVSFPLLRCSRVAFGFMLVSFFKAKWQRFKYKVTFETDEKAHYFCYKVANVHYINCDQFIEQCVGFQVDAFLVNIGKQQCNCKNQTVNLLYYFGGGFVFCELCLLRWISRQAKTCKLNICSVQTKEESLHENKVMLM